MAVFEEGAEGVEADRFHGQSMLHEQAQGVSPAIES
jgi:hypothetical protein